jgi:glycine betaine transporter
VGLSIGIKYLSNITFIIGIFLLFAVFVLDRTSCQLNLIVQSIGYYLQYNVFLINFWTNAFGQLREGEGRAIDDKAAEQWWMDTWTVVYMAWWTSWCGFVRLFIARISKGRTVRNVVLFSLFCPLIYSFIWFGVFGGMGLCQARQAMELQKVGEHFLSNPDFFEADTPNCFNVPQENVILTIRTVAFTNHLP